MAERVLGALTNFSPEPGPQARDSIGAPNRAVGDREAAERTSPRRTSRVEIGAPPFSGPMRDCPMTSEDRCFQGLGVLLVRRRARGGRGRDAVRQALGADRDRRGRRPAGRLPAPARTRARAPARAGALPGERLGDARARRAPDHRPVRLRRAAAGARAGRVRRLRPVRRPHLRAATTPSTKARRRRTSRRPTRTAPICDGCSSRPPRSSGSPVHDGGTVVVIQGPRFSTRPSRNGSRRWAGT